MKSKLLILLLIYFLLLLVHIFIHYYFFYVFLSVMDIQCCLLAKNKNKNKSKYYATWKMFHTILWWLDLEKIKKKNSKKPGICRHCLVRSRSVGLQLQYSTWSGTSQVEGLKFRVGQFKFYLLIECYSNIVILKFSCLSLLTIFNMDGPHSERKLSYRR